MTRRSVTTFDRTCGVLSFRNPQGSSGSRKSCVKTPLPNFQVSDQRVDTGEDPYSRDPTWYVDTNRDVGVRVGPVTTDTREVVPLKPKYNPRVQSDPRTNDSLSVLVLEVTPVRQQMDTPDMSGRDLGH